MEAWITRNGSQYRGPFHALGGERRVTSKRTRAWSSRYIGLCGAALERRVVAGPPERVVVRGPQGRETTAVLRPLAEWDPKDPRACGKCRKVLAERQAQEELEETRKHAEHALEEPGPTPWWHSK